MSGDFFKNCKKIGNDGVTPVEPPKIRVAAPKPVQSNKKAVKKTPPYLRQSLEKAYDIVNNAEKEGRTINREEKLECFVKLVDATDLIRRTIPSDTIGMEIQDTDVTIPWKDLGYYMEKDQHGIKIILPPVMTEKAKLKSIREKNAERTFCINDLMRFLNSEKKRVGIEESFLKDQVLIFCHERISEGYFDYDNLSTSFYINAISDTFLSADNAKNIDFLQRFVRGEENRTIVYIVPKSNFASWAKERY